MILSFPQELSTAEVAIRSPYETFADFQVRATRGNAAAAVLLLLLGMLLLLLCCCCWECCFCCAAAAAGNAAAAVVLLLLGMLLPGEGNAMETRDVVRVGLT